MEEKREGLSQPNMKHRLKKTLLLGTVTAVAICLSGCDLDQPRQDILYGPVATLSDVPAERPHPDDQY